MPVCGNYLFFELPKKIVLNPKDGDSPQVRPAHPAHLSDAAPDGRSDYGDIYRGADRGRHRGTLHRHDFCGTVQKSPAQAR